MIASCVDGMDTGVIGWQRRHRAFYSNDGVYIQMPLIEAFRDAESFCATLADESTHWTKHPSRLNRIFGRKSWGDEGYAQEELVAELASAFLCADLGITSEVRDDHAAHIASWLQVLRNDKRTIFSAAAHAHPRELRGTMFTRNKFQEGSLSREKGQRQADVWAYRWSEVAQDGSVKRRKVIVGTVDQYRTESQAKRHWRI